MNQFATEPCWEEDLAALLEDLSRVQEELLDVLIRKQELMAHGDIRGMNELQPREEALCADLQRCHDRRSQLLEAASRRGLPGDKLGSLAGALDSGDKGGLSKKVGHASGRLRLLQHQSLANWVLAQKALLHLSQMLEIIATGGRLQPTYGRDKHVTESGAFVDQEV